MTKLINTALVIVFILVSTYRVGVFPARVSMFARRFPGRGQWAEAQLVWSPLLRAEPLWSSMPYPAEHTIYSYDHQDNAEGFLAEDQVYRFSGI